MAPIRRDAQGGSGRGSWPVRVSRLGDEPGDDLSRQTTAAARLDMMWPLAIEAWALIGRPLPEYPRSQTPVTLRPSPVSTGR